MKLNLETLISQLREVDENEPRFDEEVNPYLLNKVRGFTPRVIIRTKARLTEL